ncbi:MAG: hypothetical protein ACXVFQ_18265 [Solirubrobacteraceae bacterium]
MADRDRADPRAARRGALGRFTPSDALPKHRRAIALAIVYFLVAVGLTWLEVEVVLGDGSAVVRIVVFVLLVALSVTMLMLGSDSVERGLQDLTGRRKSLAGRVLYWLTTSIVALSAAVILGAMVILILGSIVDPTAPATWEIALDFVIDIVLGALAGLLAMLSILGIGRGLEWMIQGVDTWLRPSDKAERRFPQSDNKPDQRGDHLLRGAAIGAAGLLLSALCASLIAQDQTGSADGHPPDGLGSFLRTAALPALFWLIGTAIVWWWLWARGFQAKRTSRRVRMAPHSAAYTSPHPRVLHGTHASALAICLMAVGTWVTSTTINDRTVAQLRHGHSPAATAVTVTNGQWSSASPYLAEQFEPQFRVTTDERWSPTSVSYYRLNSREITTTPFCAKDGCFELNCSDEPDPRGCPPRGDNDPALYYRYVDATHADIERIVDPNGPWKLIQYWIFYNYDWLSAGAITQWHQADWEQVSILVERTGTTVRPIEVAFSEHCYGARLAAGHVEWSGSHPISYVGVGSHANYPRPVSVPVRELRCSLGGTPPYLGVAGLFFSPAVDGTSLELPVDYLLAIRDHAVHIQSTPTPRLIPMDTTPAVSAFDGNWGRDNNLRLFGIGRIRTSAGPQAPELQPASKKPFKSMLCNSSWLNPGGHLPGWVCRAAG